ncbi:type 2 lanthipeptide synthetase LanM family protein [Gracilibacillus thailandensis]|uniref:Type 2 lantipeptide synthetase LanM n=1 Tax=Gracilibacillus thailandensis TaxID=563735 RepID=A0A6N7QYD2_9BACI|nr:type 2 lanthipeptide synthetase LanM family protein [Gracilibacillus thailandensis]MRI65901.1 type 2 lantipeptide synthetase LanM [Gracilibacillus thailandensis]
MKNVVHSNSTDITFVGEFFNPFYENMTHFFHQKLSESWNDIDSKAIDKESIILSLKEEFRKKIKDLTKKVLIYEFQDSFTCDVQEGSTKYYEMFNRKLKDSQYCWTLLQKYPVLNEIYDKTQSNLLKNSYELIIRYITDVKELEVQFNKNLGLLKAISINLGDTHRNGNSVAVLHTDKEKIIYKPRSLKADIIYTQVTNLFNNTYSETLKTPSTVDKDDYGWQEFINFEGCYNEYQIKEFFKKLGMHLAFVYAFQGSDFHYENIIASGPDPYLIDLETLFQPTLDFMEREEKQTESSFIDFLHKTVYKSLFFNNTSYPEEENPRNACALSNTHEQLIEQERIKDQGTDRVSLKKEIQYMETAYNLPSKNGNTIEIFGYENLFMQGFKKAYNFIWKNKSAILNILNQSKDFPVRIIVRPTHVYANFLTSLLHPKYLKQRSERYRVLSFFKDSYQKFSFFQKVSQFEIEDMYHGDIPYFNSYFKINKVIDSKGNQIDCKLIKRATLDEIKDRFNRLSNEDYSYQVSLINMALTALRTNSNFTGRKEVKSNSDFNISLNYSDPNNLLLKETKKVLDERLSFDNHVQWVSLSFHPSGQVVAGPLNYNLYDGLGGIGLYLIYYYNKHYSLDQNFIDSFINTIRMLYRTTKSINNISAYHGLTSYIYIVDKMLECGHVNKKDATEIYEEYCNKINKNIDSIIVTDFIGGLAGVLKVLTLLYQKYKLEFLKQTADIVYKQLISKAYSKGDMIYWKFDINKQHGLTGFSHGQTGVCYALSEYYKIIENDSKKRKNILHFIKQALNYEDEYYDPIEGNWYDNRQSRAFTFSDPFWCHGAAGILLGRIKIQHNLKNNLKVRYIREALSTTIRLGNRHTKGNSLCHGTLGNLDILIEVKNHFSGNDLAYVDSSIKSWIANYVKSMNELGWQNGFSKDISNPGLMLGKTGQLYTLLRYKDSSLPCILTLS